MNITVAPLLEVLSTVDDGRSSDQLWADVKALTRAPVTDLDRTMLHLREPSDEERGNTKLWADVRRLKVPLDAFDIGRMMRNANEPIPPISTPYRFVQVHGLDSQRPSMQGVLDAVAAAGYGPLGRPTIRAGLFLLEAICRADLLGDGIVMIRPVQDCLLGITHEYGTYFAFAHKPSDWDSVDGTVAYLFLESVSTQAN